MGESKRWSSSASLSTRTPTLPKHKHSRVSFFENVLMESPELLVFSSLGLKREGTDIVGSLRKSALQDHRQHAPCNWQMKSWRPSTQKCRDLICFPRLLECSDEH